MLSLVTLRHITLYHIINIIYGVIRLGEGEVNIVLRG